MSSELFANSSSQSSVRQTCHLSSANDPFCDTWNTLAFVSAVILCDLWEHNGGTASCLQRTDLIFHLLSNHYLTLKNALLSILRRHFIHTTTGTGFSSMGICNTSNIFLCSFLLNCIFKILLKSFKVTFDIFWFSIELVKRWSTCHNFLHFILSVSDFPYVFWITTCLPHLFLKPGLTFQNPHRHC